MSISLRSCPKQEQLEASEGGMQGFLRLIPEDMANITDLLQMYRAKTLEQRSHDSYLATTQLDDFAAGVAEAK